MTLDASTFALTASTVQSDSTGQLFDYTYAGFTLLGFDSNVDLHSSWFGTDNDLIKYATKTGCGLVLNSINTLAASYVLDLSLLSFVRSSGGYYKLSSASDLSMPQNLLGKVIDLSLASDTTVLSVAGPVLTSLNFFLSNTAAVRSFVRISMGSQGQAIFNGELFSFDVNFNGIGGVDIVDMSTSGAIDTSDVSVFTKCKIRTGAFSSSNTTLIMRDSVFSPGSISSNAVDTISLDNTTFTHLGPSLTTTSFIAKDSSITMVSAITIGSTLTTVDNCSLTLGTTGSNTSEFSSQDMTINDSTLNDFKVVATMSGSNSVKLRFEGNTCDGSFIGPEGVSGGVQHIYIRNNHFTNSNALTLYVPIVHSSFSATSELVTRGIDISGNTPLVTDILIDEDQVTLPNLATTGTRVLQTNFNVKAVMAGGLSGEDFRVPVNPTQQNFLWLPSSLYTVGTTVLNRTTFDVGSWISEDTGNADQLRIEDFVSSGNEHSTITYDGIKCNIDYIQVSRAQVSIDFFNH